VQRVQCQPIEVCGGIIEGEDVIIVRVVLLDNIHCFGDLCQDATVCEIPIVLHAWADDNMS
jgi:hypothetical protein